MNHILTKDMLLNMLLGLVGVAVALLLAIAPVVRDASQIESPGNMMVSIAWPDGPHDIDLWVQGPGDEKAVGYSNRSGKLFNLLRDDLGTSNDSGPFNREDAFSRGLPAGEYTVNVHSYKTSATLAVTVEVRIAGQGANAQLVAERTLDLRPLQERTAFRFKIDAAGNVVPGSMIEVFKPIRSAGK